MGLREEVLEKSLWQDPRHAGPKAQSIFPMPWERVTVVTLTDIWDGEEQEKTI